MAKLLDVDPLTGKKMWYQFDKDDHKESKDQHTITTVTDIEPVLQAAADDRKEDAYAGRKFANREFMRVARIPWPVWAELEKRGIASAAGAIWDQRKFAAWLNSTEGAPYRTMQGVRV